MRGRVHAIVVSVKEKHLTNASLSCMISKLSRENA